MSDPVLRKQEEDEYNDYLGFLKNLIEYGDLTDPVAIGVTKKFIAEGFDALSDKQKYVFKRGVADRFPQPMCEECSHLVPWDEAYEFMHEGARCASCQHRFDKMMRD